MECPEWLLYDSLRPGGSSSKQNAMLAGRRMASDAGGEPIMPPFGDLRNWSSDRRRRTRLRLYGAQDGRCIYCGDAMTVAPEAAPQDPMYATIEHLVPRSTGGPLAAPNLALACRACNAARGKGTVIRGSNGGV